MKIDRHSLPDDVDALKGIIGYLFDQLDAQAQQIATLLDRVQTLERQLYGRRSERLKSKSSAVSQEVTCDLRITTPAVKGHGRNRLPDTLPRKIEDYELSAVDRVCEGCGGFLSHIGIASHEQVESPLPHVHVIEHRRAKYTCRTCQDKVILAPLPAQPIEKGLLGTGLLADVIVSKYQDHLPLYRQAQRFKRMGVALSRSTLCDSVMTAAALLAPLVHRMKSQDLGAAHHLFSDDIPLRVLERGKDRSIPGGKMSLLEKSPRVRTGRMWIYASKGTATVPACTVYDYTSSRAGQGPQTFLKNFAGYLQADAYAGYNKLFEAQGPPDEIKAFIFEVMCWSHVRRRFYECALGTPLDSLAHIGLAFIQQLYKIEAQAREKNVTEAVLKIWRQDQARPVLHDFHVWLLAYKDRVLPKSKLGEAMGYTLNHWQALNTYVSEGTLEIDNNRAERGMRPIALGRKNYLFAGSNRGGHAAAILYSLIETCKQHTVNPTHYIKDVLERISTHPHAKIEDLLPYNWTPQTSLYDQHLYKIAA